MKKSLLSAMKKMQKMLLHLQKFDLEVSYKKGVEMCKADPLNQTYLSSADEEGQRKKKRGMLLT